VEAALVLPAGRRSLPRRSGPARYWRYVAAWPAGCLHAGEVNIPGPDAAVLLNWLYSNAWSKLEVGKCRYGLMLDENGMVFDDGVTVPAGPGIATPGAHRHRRCGAGAGLDGALAADQMAACPVLLTTTVTDHWATTAVVGGEGRDVLRKLCTEH